MKKFLSLLLTLCLLLGILPSQALAYVGDILPSTGSTVTTETRADGTLVLQNDYIRVTLNKHDGSLTTSPAATADSANSIDRQKPYCEFIIYGSYGYGKAHPATLRLKSAEFVDTTPNGTAKAIKAVYDLTVNLSGKSVAATTAVYYELVQLKENETSADTWGVLTSIDNIKINNNRDDLFGSLTGDMGVIWGYTLDAFSGMGHANATDGPAIKMSRTVYNYDEQVEISTESSVLTSKVENLDTWQSFSQGTDWCYNYITEVYVDGYLHLIEGKGDVVIGPSEISLTASDVGIVGTNASIIDSFGYSLKLNGQERTYNGTDYTGIYFVGSEALELDLPNTEIDVFILDTSIELGAFGGTGTKNDKQHLYLAIGANAVVKSKVQVPSDVPVIGGWKLGSWDVDLIVGGQTEFPIKDVSVDEGMKQAFSNIDVYLGAMGKSMKTRTSTRPPTSYITRRTIRTTAWRSCG